jgi:hypothetical protein
MSLFNPSRDFRINHPVNQIRAIRAIEMLDNDIMEKVLLKADDPEFNDCIETDRKCYNVARQLEKEGKLSKNKCKLLAEQKRRHIMVKMFGHNWWKK